MSSTKTLVTGAASGIGRALAERLASDGHNLVLIDKAALDDLLSDRSGIVRLQGDVSEESFWDRIAPQLDGITHAAINAGVSSGGAIDELDFAEWRRVMSVNLDGAFLSLRAALRAFRKDARAIVLTASVSGIKAEPGVSAYGASKAAVIQLMRVAAKEVASKGIRVNAIAPGGVDTPIWDGLPFFEELVASQGTREAAIEAMARMATPMGRYATAHEIAGQIAFLLSDAAGTITGAVLTSDGGYSL